MSPWPLACAALAYVRQRRRYRQRQIARVNRMYFVGGIDEVHRLIHRDRGFRRAACDQFELAFVTDDVAGGVNPLDARLLGCRVDDDAVAFDGDPPLLDRAEV